MNSRSCWKIRMRSVTRPQVDSCSTVEIASSAKTRASDCSTQIITKHAEPLDQSPPTPQRSHHQPNPQPAYLALKTLSSGAERRNLLSCFAGATTKCALYGVDPTLHCRECPTARDATHTHNSSVIISQLCRSRGSRSQAVSTFLGFPTPDLRRLLRCMRRCCF